MILTRLKMFASKCHNGYNCLNHSQYRFLSSTFVCRSRLREMQQPDKKDFTQMGYILLVIPVAAFCLGTWQVKRRKWKLALIKDLEDRTHSDPVPFPDDIEYLKDLEYRKVRVRGRFDHSNELYIMPRPPIDAGTGHGRFIAGSQAKTGAHVITPFELSHSRERILVNRGWVPRDKLDPSTRPDGQIKNEVEFTGVVRNTEKRVSFAAKNNPEHGFWQSRDVDAMSKSLGTLPVFIDADRDSTVAGGPIGGQTRVSLRNEHLSYIITWYSLSGLTFWMWYRSYWKKFKL